MKYYFYDFEGCKQTKCDFDTSLISTVSLPRFSKKHEGKCAQDYNFPKRPPIGTMFNIAFGDPRIMMSCKLISKGRKDLPEEVRKLIKDKSSIYIRDLLCFEYNGGRLYIDRDRICTLENMENA